jgi:hypothetical protein
VDGVSQADLALHVKPTENAKPAGPEEPAAHIHHH